MALMTKSLRMLKMPFSKAAMSEEGGVRFGMLSL
jgi:hypothetical protein